MDFKTTKLTEMTMSNYLFGESLDKEPALKLKPKLKTASYFTICSECLVPTSDNKKGSLRRDCSFIVSDEMSKTLTMVSNNDVIDIAQHITPQGMILIDDGKLLVVIDKYGGGVGSNVSTVNFYSLKNNGEFVLIDKMCRTTNGTMTSCWIYDDDEDDDSDNIGNSNCVKKNRNQRKSIIDNNYSSTKSSSGSVNGKLDIPKDVCTKWQPRDIIQSKHGNLVISDTSKTCLNRLSMFSPDGKIITEFGRAKGPGEQTFQKPLHLAVDLYGRVFASDYLTNSIQVYDNRGFWLHSIGSAETTSRNGSASHMLGYDSRLQGPLGIACDSLGNIVVCDSKNHRMAMFASNGKYIENTKIEKSKSTKNHPVSVHIDSKLNVLAACYHSSKKDIFKKILVKGIKPLCE